MGQPLLQVGISSSASSVDKTLPSDSRVSSKGKDDSTFSSTLNEQIDKSSELKSKKKSDVDTSQKSVSKKSDEKVEQSSKSEGKLKDEGATSTAATDEEGANVSEIDEKGDITVLIESDADLVDDKEVAAVDSAPKTSVDSSSLNLATPIVTEGKSVIPATLEATEEATSEELPSKPILRSDILNAITKKQEQGSQGPQANTAISALKDTVINANQGELAVGERQNMTKMLSEAKANSLLNSGQQERALSNLMGNTTSAVAATSTLSSTATAPLAPVAQPALLMQPSVQSEAWGKVLSSRVVWMAKEGVQQAELRLNPANLGPVEVKLHMNNDQANVSFIAHHAATRDALEQALPKLRESFQDNGMSLANADVSEQASQQQSEGQAGKETSAGAQVNSEQDDINNDVVLPSQNSGSEELELGVSVFA